jgi:hypothetical protein
MSSAHEMREPPVEIYQSEIDSAVAKWFEQHPLELVVAWGAVHLEPIEAEEDLDGNRAEHTFTVQLDADVPHNCVVKVRATAGDMPVTALSFRVAYVTARTVGLVAIPEVDTPACLVTVAAYTPWHNLLVSFNKVKGV